MLGAGEILGERNIAFRSAVSNDHHAVAPAQSSFHGVRQSSAESLEFLAIEFPHHQAVNDGLDVVNLVAVESDLIVHRENFSIDTQAYKSRTPHLLDHRLVGPLAASHQGREDQNARFIRQRLDGLNDLLRRLASHLTIANRAVGYADAREKQAKIIVDLGHGSNRGPGVV